MRIGVVGDKIGVLGVGVGGCGIIRSTNLCDVAGSGFGVWIVVDNGRGGESV